MFDLLGWRWTYEPFDCNGWSPDFVLHRLRPEGNDVLVEVKGPPSELEAAKAKIESCGTSYETLLIGPKGIEVFEGHFMAICCIGEIGEQMEGDISWQGAAFGKDHPGVFDFTAIEGSFVQRLTGYYPGGSHPGLSLSEAREVKRFWGIAHERTRFTVR